MDVNLSERPLGSKSTGAKGHWALGIVSAIAQGEVSYFQQEWSYVEASAMETNTNVGST